MTESTLRTYRETIDLCGSWRFQPDPFEEGQRCGFFEPAFDASSWHEATIPSTFERTLPSLIGYEGAAWYRREVQIPESWRHQRVVICFEGANYRTTVWVNGIELGRNEDGFLPFEFAINQQLKFGNDNTIAVCVDNTRRLEDVPGRQRGWRPHGGILREVSLVASAHERIENLHITAEPREVGGQLDAVVELAIEGRNLAEYDLSLTVRNAASDALARFSLKAAARVLVSGTVRDVAPWSPNAPNLYQAVLELRKADEVIDRREMRIGFRKIESQTTRLLLNGTPVFLTGFNLHEDSPRTDFCPDHELRRQDLLSMKQMGCNFVRLCHYPHHPHTLEMCDEIGLLAMAEIPLYWWPGTAEGEENFVRKKQAARRQLERMITRDCNHPSIIIWAVSNETPEDRPEIAEANAELVKLCKTLDATRLATHVSNRWMDSPHFEEDDLIAVNGYPTHGIFTADQDTKSTDTDGSDWWKNELATLHVHYPDKPILVSEFGYPAMEGVKSGAIGEQAQAKVIEQEYSGFDAPYVCGTIIWCYADHPWPEGCFINGIGISPYGVATRARQKKKAFSVVQNLFKKMQSRSADTSQSMATTNL